MECYQIPPVTARATEGFLRTIPPVSRGPKTTSAIQIARPLLRWYRRQRRDLPWRRTRDPYAIWLAESMLQQTQVATVIPYYERFLARFPTVEALAASSLDDVLGLWAGLGYYARARNLHAAARMIVEQHAGHVPDTVDALRHLPGVGRYTAGAVGSIAFGRRAAVVDGNVIRVLARLHALRDDVKKPATVATLWTLAESLLPKSDCGDHNQALMELGAMICTPAAPRCEGCPLSGVCRARALGLTDSLPIGNSRAAVRAETHAVLAIESPRGWLFVRRPEAGLWGGLWELPSTRQESNESVGAAIGRLADELGLRVGAMAKRPFCRFEHVLTHRRITFVAFRARLDEASHVDRDPTARVARSVRSWRPVDEADQLGLSRAMQRIVAALTESSARPARSRRARAGAIR